MNRKEDENRCWFISSNSVFPVHVREIKKKFKKKYSLESKYTMSMSGKTLPFKFYACCNLVFCFSISIFQYRKTSIKHAVIRSSHSDVCIQPHHNRKHMLHLLHLTPTNDRKTTAFIKTFSRGTEIND